jgi:Ca-activated chloride channel family protein
MRPGAEAPRYLLLRIKAASERPGPRPRLSTMLAIDVSGSMGGQPLQHVISSAQRIASLLQETDELGVVTFNATAQTTSPLRAMSPASRRLLDQEVSALQAAGNTNISAGLSRAALCFPARSPGVRQLILLLSDGQPNQGASEPHELGAEAKLIRTRGVAVSTLGYGSNHDEKVLQAISDSAGGRYAFVSDPPIAEGSFVRALGAQLDVVAEGLRVALQPSEDVDIVRVVGEADTSFGADGFRIALPDLIAGDELNIVIEIKVRAWRDGRWPLLTATVSGAVSGSGESLAVTATPTFTVGAEVSEASDPSAQAPVTITLAAELRARARAAADRGQFVEAIALIQQARALIEQSAGFAAGQRTPLNDALEALIDDATVYQQRPDKARYEHYRKAQHGHLDFAQQSSRVRGELTSPSAVAMSRQRVSRLAPDAILKFVGGDRDGERFALTEDRVIIGRGSYGTDLVIVHENVSRKHAVIETVGASYWVVDLGSTGGTSVNGKFVTRHELRPGDVIKVGPVQLAFERLA